MAADAADWRQPLMKDLLVNWASFYSNHALARTLITFAHIGGLVVAGGAAMTVDRSLLSYAHRDSDNGRAKLAATRSSHGFVLWGLVFVTISGLLLFAADVDTYWASRVFWIKIGLIALLVVNGLALMWSERRATAGDSSAWTTLRWTAAASITFWMLTTLAGVALLNM
jgi:uncharacterized membrane protein